MYAFIDGTLVELGRDRVNLLTPAGVAYEILIVESERSEYPSTGSELRLFTHLHVRENEMSLYGFLSRANRDFFRQLLPQKGIGPRLALSVLSDLGSEAFREAVFQQDLETLTRVKGVGEKTARRLVVELGEQLPRHPEDTSTYQPVMHEASEALVGLGFDKKEAGEAVRRALDDETFDPDGESLEELISRSLEHLE